MIRGLVPNALWWFRWGAMFTFITGLLVIFTKLGHDNVGLGSGYMTLILTGGLMGILMWFNVWFVIWPAQQVVIANAENVAGGGEADPSAAGRGGGRELPEPGFRPRDRAGEPHGLLGLRPHRDLRRGGERAGGLGYRDAEAALQRIGNHPRRRDPDDRAVRADGGVPVGGPSPGSQEASTSRYAASASI
jgi:hypothetical protein